MSPQARHWALWIAGAVIWVALSGGCTLTALLARDEFAWIGFYGIVTGFGLCVLAGALLSPPHRSRAAAIFAVVLGGAFLWAAATFRPRPDGAVPIAGLLTWLPFLAWLAALAIGVLTIALGLYAARQAMRASGTRAPPDQPT